MFRLVSEQRMIFVLVAYLCAILCLWLVSVTVSVVVFVVAHCTNSFKMTIEGSTTIMVVTVTAHWELEPP